MVSQREVSKMEAEENVLSQSRKDESSKTGMSRRDS